MRDKIDFDVIVVGAGLSGLTAAHTLLEKVPTLNVLVLESSERIGGRLLSKSLACKDASHHACYNLGGEFIAHAHVHLLELLEQLDLKPKILPKVNGRYVIENQNGKIAKTVSHNPFEICNQADQFQLFRFFLKLEELSACVSFSNPFKYAHLDRVTLEKFMKPWFLSEKAKDIFRSLVLRTCGVKTTEISALFYLALLNSMRGLDFLRNGDLFFVEGGSEEICYSICRKLLRLDLITIDNDTVEQIQEYDDGVVVETTENTYHCSYIVIAVQLSAIKNIVFDPKLWQASVFCNVLEGRLIKFVATYKTAFWSKNGFCGQVLNCNRKSAILSCYDATTKERPALSGLIYRNEHQNDCNRDGVLKQLSKYFGKEALEPVSYCEYAWNGTGSPMCSLGLKTMVDFSRNFCLNKRLFWGCAEITDYYHGHMEGAVHSGFKAAIQVLYEYRPSVIGVSDVVKMSEPGIKPEYLYKDTFKASLLQKKVVVPVLVILAYVVLRTSRCKLDFLFIKR